MDITVLLNKIQNVDMAVKLLQDGINGMCDTNKLIHEKNVSHENGGEKWGTTVNARVIWIFLLIYLLYYALGGKCNELLIVIVAIFVQQNSG